MVWIARIGHSWYPVLIYSESVYKFNGYPQFAHTENKKFIAVKVSLLL